VGSGVVTGSGELMANRPYEYSDGFWCGGGAVARAPRFGSEGGVAFGFVAVHEFGDPAGADAVAACGFGAGDVFGGDGGDDELGSVHASAWRVSVSYVLRQMFPMS